MSSSKSPSPPPPQVPKAEDDWAYGIYSPKSPTKSSSSSSPTMAPSTPPQKSPPAVSSPIQVCGFCGKHMSEGYKKCKRCKNVFYCSQSCQKRDWQYGHKGVCIQFPLSKELPKNSLASVNFLPRNYDLVSKPLVGPPALRGSPQDLVPLLDIVKDIVPTLQEPNGFLNLSMVNCYVNCIVQSLFSLPIFRTYLLRKVHSKKHNSGIINSKDNCFLCNFEKCCLMHMESPDPISLDWIIHAIGSREDLHYFIQQDAHEFLLKMLSRMELESTETGKDPIGSDISQLFGGWTCKLSECDECKATETLYERYSVLSVDVTDTTNTVDESIKSLIAPEQSSGHECSACKKKVKMFIRNMFVSYPPVLVIHLKRFMNNGSDKAACHIDFPEHLDMRPYILPSYGAPSKRDDIASLTVARSINDSHFAYRLCGVVAHMGIAQFGHYVSYVVNSRGEWLVYSDAEFRKVPFSDVAKAQAYILFYQQENTELLGVPCFLRNGPPSENAPCLGGCGMYGTKENSYYCSVCYKKHFSK